MAEWWRGAVIYQVYPRSYQDSTGNGIGDLNGITSRLPHIAELGADAVWLSPIFTSPMDDMGYDVANYTEVEPLFGTMQDFDLLVQRAHDLDLKIILDQVLSHTSDRHPWFIESRSSRDNDRANWYVWADANADGTPPNNWLSNFGGGAWEWDSKRRQYYLHNFLASQPDLNFYEPEVQDALLDTMRFWIGRGVDGFRLDTVNYYHHDDQLRSDPAVGHGDKQPTANPYNMQNHIHSKNRPINVAFLKRMRKLLDEHDDLMLVGEVGEALRAIEIMAEYTRDDDRLHMAYSFEMLGPSYTAQHFRSRIQQFNEQAPDGCPCWSFSNHDVVRHVTRWQQHGAGHDQIAKQACALLSSFQGAIGIYQGEELGLSETDIAFDELTDPPGIRLWPDYKGRDGCRTPMPWDSSAQGGFTTGTPWLPIKEPQHKRHLEGQQAANNSVLHFYRQTLHWRRDNPLLRDGTTTFFETSEPILAFSRGDGEDRIFTCFNLSTETLDVKAEGLSLSEGAPNIEAEIKGGTLKLGPNGSAFMMAVGSGEPHISYS